MSKRKILDFKMKTGETAGKLCPFCLNKLYITTHPVEGKKIYDCSNRNECKAHFEYMSNIIGFELSKFSIILQEIGSQVYYNDMNEEVLIVKFQPRENVSNAPINPNNKFNFLEYRLDWQGSVSILTKLSFPISKEQLLNKVKIYSVLS